MVSVLDVYGLYSNLETVVVRHSLSLVFSIQAIQTQTSILASASLR